MKLQIPNLLTILRIILIPFFLFFLIPDETLFRIIALFIFILSSITDFLDGYLARKLNAESSFGKTLDPLADKMLVISTLFAFIYLDNQIPIWMVLVIIGRDILITFMRALGKRRNIEIKTSRLAKAKTAFQMFSIIIILVIFAVRSYRSDIQDTFHKGKKEGRIHSEIALEKLKRGIFLWPEKKINPEGVKKVFAQSIPYFLMLFVTILTIVSGIRYLIINYKIFLKPREIKYE